MKRVRAMWVYKFAGSTELRIEEVPGTALTPESSKAIADHIHQTQGLLCSDCHKAARFRIVLADQPEKARCWYCNENAAVAYGAGTTRG